MQVTLVNYTPNIVFIDVAGARYSASQTGIEELWRKLYPHQTCNLSEQFLNSHGITDLKSKRYHLDYCRK